MAISTHKWLIEISTASTCFTHHHTKYSYSFLEPSTIWGLFSLCGVSGSCLSPSFLSVFLSGTIRSSKQYLTQNPLSRLIPQVMIEVMNKYSALDILKGSFILTFVSQGLLRKFSMLKWNAGIIFFKHEKFQIIFVHQLTQFIIFVC